MSLICFSILTLDSIFISAFRLNEGGKHHRTECIGEGREQTKTCADANSQIELFCPRDCQMLNLLAMVRGEIRFLGHLSYKRH